MYVFLPRGTLTCVLTMFQFPYDTEKAPDWRTAPLWTYSVLQKAGIDKQGAIRYVRLGMIKEFLFVFLVPF